MNVNISEIDIIKNFFVNGLSKGFQYDNSFDLNTDNFREFLLLSSILSTGTFGVYSKSFFLKKEGEAYYPHHLYIGYDFTDNWLKDEMDNMNIIHNKKYIKFFRDPVPTSGFSSEYYTKKKVQECYSRLYQNYIGSKNLNDYDVLFIPLTQYKDGFWLSETLFHYIFGSYIKQFNFLIYQGFPCCNNMAIPDISAFKDLESLNILKDEGLISSGLFFEELQLLRIENNMETSRDVTINPLDNIYRMVIEIKVRWNGQKALYDSLSKYSNYSIIDAILLGAPTYGNFPCIELNNFGSIFLNEKGEIQINISDSSCYDKKKDDSIIDYLESQVKQNLCKNLGLSEILDLINNQFSKKPKTYVELLKSINQLPTSEICNSIIKHI